MLREIIGNDGQKKIVKVIKNSQTGSKKRQVNQQLAVVFDDVCRVKNMRLIEKCYYSSH